MTTIRAGVVDVVIVRPLRREWKILVLRRAATASRAGAWELVHGSIERAELPAAAARREVQEETGLAVRTLYSITVNPFYVQQTDTVQLAIVFAAFVDSSRVTLGVEHDAHEWLTLAQATRRVVWPREAEALAHVRRLLKAGHAGPVDDVLRA